MEQINNIQSFSFKRILLLMQKTLYENAKSVLIGLITIFGLFSFILLMSALKNGAAWSKLQTFYFIGLFIAGFFISGSAFSNFRNKEKTMSYIILPASVFEKVISEWLLTTIVFIIGYTAIFYVFNFLLLLLGNSFGINVDIINIFNFKFIKLLPTYLIVQSIFLAGAATFRKSPFFKTIFVLFLFNIFLTVWLSILMYSLNGTFESMAFNINGMNYGGGHISYNIENSWVISTVKIMYYYITAPVFWIYTYFKLKEKEA